MRTLSDEIRACRDGVIHNPFQGKDKKVVFVCSMGILRSATAARLYAHKYNTRSTGSWNDALIPLTATLLEWADEVVFVNREIPKIMPELLIINPHDDCAICIEPQNNGVKFGNCSHWVCQMCWSRLMHTNPVCPLCRCR